MRPTDYESAALPTELSRHADLTGTSQPHPDIPATTTPRRVSVAGLQYHGSAAAQLTALSAIPRDQLPRFKQVVYVLRAYNGLLKFGTSRDVRTRLSGVQADSPDPIHCVAWAFGGMAEEAALHIRLMPHMHHAEWFLPSAEVLAVVQSLKRIVATLHKKHGPDDYTKRYGLTSDLRLERNRLRREVIRLRCASAEVCAEATR